MSIPPTPIKVFYSCADTDVPLLEQLERHLSILQYEGLISLPHKRRIVAGADWQVEQDRHLNSAWLILLLISPDFLNSDYLYRVELQRAMKRHKDKEAHVIPILLRSCDWEGAPFEKLQVLPRNRIPLKSWPDLDAGFTEVVKEIRLALQGLPSLPFSTPAPKLPLWNVPYNRNRYFTGRDELFGLLDQYLTPTEQTNALEGRRVALTQPHAITGLGGIGKTQIAIEYAYRSRALGQYTHTLWINAASEETIIASFVSIANLLPSLAVHQETDQRGIVEAVKDWLEHCEHRWLLIFDNADEVAQVCNYLPQGGNGSILLTTRAHAVGSLATSVEVEKMNLLEGTHLLLRRAQRFEHASDEEVNQAENIVIALDHFPLAIDQAGAYIEEAQCSFVDYLDLYRTHRQALLAKRGMLSTDYPHSVATTWSLSFQKVEQGNPAASELLRLCAFLAPDPIPEKLIKDSIAHWPVLLQEAATDPLLFQQLITDLLKFSLVKRLVEEHTLSIHRLVQAVQRDQMSEQNRQQWAVRVVRAVRAALPPVEPAYWPYWKRIMPHAQLCAQHIKEYDMQFTAATDLLSETGLYLVKHAQYKEAEKLYRDCLNILKKSQCPDSLLPKAIVLINLGNIYSETGKYNKAKKHYKKSLDIFKRNQELDDCEFARLLNNLAILFKVRGKPTRAEELYICSLNIQIQSFVTSGEAKKKQSPPDKLDIATLSNVLGKSKEEINTYIRCLLSEQTALRKFAQVLNNLAVLYAEQLHKYETAKRLFRLSLWLQKQYLRHDTSNEKHGPRLYDSDYALSLNNLANLYTVWGSNPEVQPDERRTLYEQAVSFYQKSEDILKKWHNRVDHPELAYPLHGQGILHFQQGRDKEAEECYLNCLAIWKNLRRYHPQVGYACYNLANLYVGYKEAEEYYQECLRIWKKHLGTRHLHTRTCKKIYAILCHNPKGETDVLKAELVVLPTYRSFRLWSSQNRS